MADFSRKVLKESVDRLLKKGVSKIASEEVNIGSILKNLANSARSTTAATGEHVDEAKERAKNVGETVLTIAKSVESFGDLEQRIRAHKGEFVEAARTFSLQIHEALAHLVEPTRSSNEEEVLSGEISPPAGEVPVQPDESADPKD